MSIKNLYFVGIGGAGMAPLADIALDRGYRVTGSDRELNAKTDELARRGATIYAGHDAAHFNPAAADLLVYSSAVPPENPERMAARAHGIPELRRGEFLAVLTGEYPRTVAISGSHGKTTTTAMLVWILRHTGRAPGYLIGGCVPGMEPGHAGSGDIFVTEADESDGTHTALHPWLGLVPNADDDHSWSVGGEEGLRRNFRTFAEHCGRLIYYRNFVKPGWFDDLPRAEALDAAAPAMERELPMWHGFQRKNAYLAIAGAEKLGVTRQEAIEALADFPGVERRMTVRAETAAYTVIEDYAHHPAEVADSIELLRSKYPNRYLRVLFQPHRYARLAKYLPELARVLGGADSVVIAPVFAAWSETGKVNGADLARAIGEKARYSEGTWETIAADAKQAMPQGGILAVIGAGDVEKTIPYLM